MFFTQLELSYDWQDSNDITFLHDLRHLKGLVIESTKSFDLSPVGACSKLTYLNIASKIANTSVVDLSRLPIKTFLAKDNETLASIYNSTTVKHLTISGYAYADLSQFKMNAVERIAIDGSRVLTSLKGIEQLANLKLVEVNRCPKLTRPLLYINEYPYLRIYVDGVLQK